MKLKDWPKLPLVMIALMFAAAALAYEKLPARIPVHWGLNGVDRWADKSFLSVFQLPLMALGLYVLLMVMPYLDPKRQNLLKSKHIYFLVIDLVVGLQLVILLGTIAAAFREGFPVDRLVLLGTCVMFVVLGNFLGRVKQNWTMGARYSWTLEDPEVWRKTNRLTGRLFVAAGVLGATGAFLPNPWPVVMLIVPALLVLPVTYVYAYLLFRKRHPEQYRDAEAG